MSEFHRVCSISEIPDPGKASFEVDERIVVLIHSGGQFTCLDDVCTHDGGPLADGELDDTSIACPRHGAKFDIRDGSALTMPATMPTAVHEVKVDGDDVSVRIVDETETVIESETSTGEIKEDLVRETLKKVIDPELFVNIVDLGLIYVVAFEPSDGDKVNVKIDMTMTSPACPAGPQLIAGAKNVVGQIPGVDDVEVRIVMDPPWTPDRMTEDARDQLGIF